jgi:hypothetical protein
MPLFAGTAVRVEAAPRIVTNVDARRGTAMTYPIGRPDSGDLKMQVGRFLFSSLMGLGLLTATVALLFIWMFLTEPVELARSVRQGSTTDMVRVFAAAVYDLVRSLVAWL